MKFDLKQTFDAPLAQVEAAWLDAKFATVLEQGKPGAKAWKEIESKDEGGKRVRRVQFTPDADLPAYARGAIKPEMLELTLETSHDPATHRTDWRVMAKVPEHWNERFRVQGTCQLADLGGKTERLVDGEVTIKVTLVGGMAEKFVGGLVQRMFTAEADLMQGFLKQA
jgi:hypothetical protein